MEELLKFWEWMESLFKQIEGKFFCVFFVAHQQVDHLYLSIHLTTLLLVDTTDTGFSLVDFNEALEIILLVWQVQDL